MSCSNCGRVRVVSISLTVQSAGYAMGTTADYAGNVPAEFGLGTDGDQLDFELCLNCGQVQGQWPAPISSIDSQAVSKSLTDPFVAGGSNARS
jgi:hypothetical protein